VRAALVAVAVFVVALGTPPATNPAQAGAAHSLIQGSGSSWSANAVNQWIADVQATGLQVVFTASGSAQGRKDFGYRTNDFAISEIGFQGADPITGESDTPQGRAYAYLPIVSGGTAFPYQIRVRGQLVRNLRLSGQTLAKIFTNQITDWSDPQITADNNGRALPSLPIIPVVHAEGAGSTAHFTDWLDKQYPTIWRPFVGGAGMTEYYPRKDPAIAQSGSDGVMNFVASAAANGAIGYDEYSYALGKNYPVAKIENAAGYYALPTQYNVAVALTRAIINEDRSSPDYLLQTLDNVYTYADPRVYPLSSYSYMIEPTAPDDSKMTTAKRQTLADFLYYSICDGQKEMGPIGYSPLPVNLVQAGFDQIGKLKQADAGVDLTSRDVSTCHNPTFVPGQPNQNYLAQIAPMPPSCDQSGQGPCAGAGDPGTKNPPTTAGGGGGGGPGGSGGSGGASKAQGGTGAAGTGPGATDAVATNGATATDATGPAGTTPGQATDDGASGTGDSETAAAVLVNPRLRADTLSASPPYDVSGEPVVLAPLAVLLLIAAIVVPALLARRLSPVPDAPGGDA
jgi:ABC-type phosphate transport system substrate-binding protein